MSKKALLVISFGTSEAASRELDIAPAEMALAKAFPEYDFERAFASRMVIDKIKNRDGITIEHPGQVIERLYRAGYQEILIQPLLIIAGIEYERLLAEITPYKDRFERFEVGAPLLVGPEDYEAVLQLLQREIRPGDSDKALVLMGHGSRHSANVAYSILEKGCRTHNLLNIYVATVEGKPTLEEIIPRLKADHIRKVTLMPFMLVAGNHAQNDMAGDADGSWKNTLEREGFSVAVRMASLGQREEIRQIFVNHARAAHKNWHK